MILLDENKNPFYPNKKMLRFLKKASTKVSKYSSIRQEEVLSKISEAFNIASSNILFTNGTMDAFSLIINQFDSFGVIKPTFWGFDFIASQKNKKVIVEISENYNENLIEKLNDLAKKVSCIYICNPNNPTLDNILRKEILKLIKNNSGCHFVIDETLLPYHDNYLEKSLYNEVLKFSNLSVLVSFSKFLGIAGLRAGLIFSNEEFIKSLKMDQSPFSINLITEMFAKEFIHLLTNSDKVKRKIFKNYKYLIDNINKDYVINIVNTNSCFVLIQLTDTFNISDLKDFMEKNKIVLRYSTELKYFNGNWLRISAGKIKDYKVLIKKFNTYVKKLNKK